MTKEKVVEIYIPSELGYEKIPISAAAAVAQKMEFALDRIEDLKTAVGEAVINAIEHGNQFNVDIRVLITLTIQDDALALHVVDEGRQPIPADVMAGRTDRSDNRGWGMFLIKNLVDKVEVLAAPNRNEIRMVIYLEH